MKFMFIGTGSGVTSTKRSHSSILIQKDSYNLLIDCGDGTAKALKQRGIAFNTIDAILFSHYHADHFAGIAALITQMHIQKRQEKLFLYTHRNLVEPLENILKYTYLFKETLGFELDVQPYESGNKIQPCSGLTILPAQNSHIRNKHNITSYAEDRFISSSFLVETEGKQIAYTADIGSKEDLFLFEEYTPEIFISETSHIELDWLLETASEIKPREIILTHISDEDEYKIQKWLKNLPSGVNTAFSMAEDGHIVTLSH